MSSLRCVVFCCMVHWWYNLPRSWEMWEHWTKSHVRLSFFCSRYPNPCSNPTLLILHFLPGKEDLDDPMTWIWIVGTSTLYCPALYGKLLTCWNIAIGLWAEGSFDYCYPPLLYNLDEKHVGLSNILISIIPAFLKIPEFGNLTTPRRDTKETPIVIHVVVQRQIWARGNPRFPLWLALRPNLV